jgi:uncharacterized protein (TIGR03067 family)
MRVLVLSLVSVAFAVAAPLPFPKPPRTDPDFKALQGQWVVVRERSGHDQGPSPVMFRFSGNRLTCFVKGAVDSDWEFALDRTRTPKKLTMRRTARDGAAVAMPYAYSVEGDTLYLAYKRARPDGSPPTNLNGDEGDWLFVCKHKR